MANDGGSYMFKEVARNSFTVEQLKHIIENRDKTKVQSVYQAESRHGSRNSYDCGNASVWREGSQQV